MDGRKIKGGAIATLVGDRATVNVTESELTGTIRVDYYGSFEVDQKERALELARYIAHHGPGDVVG